MILRWAYMKKFCNKVHFRNADSTIREVYFERKSKSILFLRKKNKKKGCFSMRLNCLNEFRRNKIFFKIKGLIVFPRKSIDFDFDFLSK